MNWFILSVNAPMAVNECTHGGEHHFMWLRGIGATSIEGTMMSIRF
jgi:hypothetical protein